MPHVVVVGAGVFGAWTAHHLRAAGAQVTLIDQYGPANPRASSGDHSRILRCGTALTRSIPGSPAARSSSGERWTSARRVALASVRGTSVGGGRRPLLHRHQTDARGGGYALEVLDASRLRVRYPHLDASDVAMALLEPECGVLMARRAVRTLVRELVQSGTEYLRGRVDVVPSPGAVKSLLLADGAGVHGDAFVFACGPWLPSVFRATLDGLIRPTRQNVIYFGGPPGDERFGPGSTPVDRSSCWDIRHPRRGGLRRESRDRRAWPAIDPDGADRTPDAGAIARARAWVERRFPAMKGAPVVEARVCQYETPPTAIS